MGFQDEEILKKKKELEQQKKLRESQDRLEKEAEESIYDEIVHIIGRSTFSAQRDSGSENQHLYAGDVLSVYG